MADLLWSQPGHFHNDGFGQGQKFTEKWSFQNVDDYTSMDAEFYAD